MKEKVKIWPYNKAYAISSNISKTNMNYAITKAFLVYIIIC